MVSVCGRYRASQFGSPGGTLLRTTRRNGIRAIGATKDEGRAHSDAIMAVTRPHVQGTVKSNGTTRSEGFKHSGRRTLLAQEVAETYRTQCAAKIGRAHV